LPYFRYSFQEYDPLIHVRSAGREVDISPKSAREICKEIRGKRLQSAKQILEDIISKRRSIAFKRYKLKSAHRSDQQNFPTGGYPVKAAKAILEVTKNLEGNAEFKGMDTERLVIIHASALRGRVIKAYIPRAQGRSTPDFHMLTHIELIGKEA
jgi:large subunit ribosomal protein L22